MRKNVPLLRCRARCASQTPCTPPPRHPTHPAAAFFAASVASSTAMPHCAAESAGASFTPSPTGSTFREKTVLSHSIQPMRICYGGSGKLREGAADSLSLSKCFLEPTALGSCLPTPPHVAPACHAHHELVGALQRQDALALVPGQHLAAVWQTWRWPPGGQLSGRRKHLDM